MANPQPPVPPPQQFNSAPLPITCDYTQRQFVMFQITEDELEQLVSGSAPLNWGLFGVCAGGFLSFLSTLLSTTISGLAFSTFVMLTVLFLILSYFFGIQGYKESQAAQKRVSEIKRTSNR